MFYDHSFLRCFGNGHPKIITIMEENLSLYPIKVSLYRTVSREFLWRWWFLKVCLVSIQNIWDFQWFFCLVQTQYHVVSGWEQDKCSICLMKIVWESCTHLLLTWEHFYMFVGVWRKYKKWTYLKIGNVSYRIVYFCVCVCISLSAVSDSLEPQGL